MLSLMKTNSFIYDSLSVNNHLHDNVQNPSKDTAGFLSYKICERKVDSHIQTFVKLVDKRPLVREKRALRQWHSGPSLHIWRDNWLRNAAVRAVMNEHDGCVPSHLFHIKIRLLLSYKIKLLCFFALPSLLNFLRGWLRFRETKSPTVLSGKNEASLARGTKIYNQSDSGLSFSHRNQHYGFNSGAVFSF